MKYTTEIDDEWKKELRKEYALEERRDRIIQERRFVSEQEAYRLSRPLHERAREAIAWGVADHETTGITQTEAVKLISELLKENERLRNGR